MSDAAQPLALERNLALMAGAGAGKTYSLVTMALHLLAGAREGAEPLSASRLCLVTFTDKAAAELRARLRGRVEALAQGRAGPGEEPELRASLERLGRGFPPPERWRQVREELAGASVGTFHSLCAQLLRRAPQGLGMALGFDPGFEVLDALEARTLVHEVCERVVLEALETEAPAGAAVRELCQELTFAGTGFSEGLVDALVSAYGALREEGLHAADARLGTEPEARAGLQAMVQECLELCAQARASDPEGEWTALCAAAEAALQGMTAEDFLSPGRFPALLAALSADPRDVARRSKGAPGRVRALRWRVFGKSDDSVLRLQDAYATWRMVPFEEAFRALLAQVEAAHAAELQRRGGLDFTALLVRARDLLRDHPAQRSLAQQRVGALLVDEFQDTNRLQLELVLLLSERREGAPRVLAPGEVRSLPLEPALLCAVGDRKQSIYEFRGADVSVFSELGRHVLEEGGAQHFLQHNRRSTPALLAFFNGAFAHLMAARPGAPAFDVGYVPAQDDLRAVRADIGGGAAVERLRAGEGASTAALRAHEADAVARRLAALLAADAPPSVMREGRLQRARGGDVAVLFRSFTHLELYRQALIRHGVPHRVLRGRGFYGAQEVLDLAALLSLLADPEDVLAFATVLRSPLVGLSDAGLLRVAGEDGLQPGSPRLQRLSELGLAPDEQLRLERFLAALPSLRRERDRLGVRALLQAAMSVTGYREALAASPFAEQASANVHKLLALAARRDERGAGGCVALARELRHLAEVEPREAQAELLDVGDPHAVQLLTIHRAKGLEWPVVVVPALGSRRRTLQGRAHVARDGRLALRPWLPDWEGPLRSARHEAVRAELAAREAAEYKRLLYVALTRARDRLILAGASEPNTSGTWWQLLEACLAAQPQLRALVEDVDARALALPGPAAPGPEDAEAAKAAAQAATAELEAALARVRGPVLPAPARGEGGWVLAVGALLAAPRCEGCAAAVPEEEPGVDCVDTEAWQTPRSVGERTRRLLERVDFALALQSPSARAAHLASLAGHEGWALEDAQVETALALAERVLASAWARELAQGPAAALHRRLPYALPLEDAEEVLTLEGQVDLLRELAGGGAELVLYRDVARPARGAGGYARELAAARLAAGALLPAGAPVRAGVLFLREARPEPEFLALDAAPERLARGLWTAARALREGAPAAGSQKAGCQALCCESDEGCFPGPGA